MWLVWAWVCVFASVLLDWILLPYWAYIRSLRETDIPTCLQPLFFLLAVNTPPLPDPWLSSNHHLSFTLDIGSSVQFSSVAQSCPTLCDPMDCSTPGLPVHHPLLELTQTHVCHIGDAMQPSHPLSSPSPLAFHLSQHQDHFKWVSSSHQVAKVLEFQLQHQSFQWTPRTDL